MTSAQKQIDRLKKLGWYVTEYPASGVINIELWLKESVEDIEFLKALADKLEQERK